MKHLACILALLPLFLFAACGSEQTSLDPAPSEKMLEAMMNNNADNDTEIEEDADGSVLLSPYPTEGEIIATIQGKEYHYDPVYLFYLDGSRNWQELTKENAYQAIALELNAIEGELLYRGYGYKEEEIQKTEDRIKNRDVSLTDEEKVIFEERLADILETENITEDEFWDTQTEYAAKIWYIGKGAEYIWSQRSEHPEIYDAYDYFRSAHKELREKYNVVFTYSFED
ncbi:MAG: hypothetical protein IJC82_06395 [Firmicutes bacterium]|nr:hypothetical protein [Bacillota bacterium]